MGVKIWVISWGRGPKERSVCFIVLKIFRKSHFKHKKHFWYDFAKIRNFPRFFWIFHYFCFFLVSWAGYSTSSWLSGSQTWRGSSLSPSVSMEKTGKGSQYNFNFNFSSCFQSTGLKYNWFLDFSTSIYKFFHVCAWTLYKLIAPFSTLKIPNLRIRKIPSWEFSTNKI